MVKKTYVKSYLPTYLPIYVTVVTVVADSSDSSDSSDSKTQFATKLKNLNWEEKKGKKCDKTQKLKL